MEGAGTPLFKANLLDTMRGKVLLVALVSVVTGILGAGANASHSGGNYEQELSVAATEAVQDVIIIPPGHGQIVNGNGLLGGADPNEATPFNSYLRAIERGIDDWRKAIKQFGPSWLSERLVFNVYVVGRDSIPASALADPEILIVNEETKGVILGLAVVQRITACVVMNSSWFVLSFTPEDFYNVSAHEFGHCLGIRHIVENHPPDDLMASTYSQSPGSRGNRLQCISNLNVKAVEASFGFLVGRPVPAPLDRVSVPVSEYQRTDCGTLQSPGPQPSPNASPSPSRPPEPSQTPSSSPSPNPSRDPEPSPSPTPKTEVVFHERMVSLKLSRHLIARGRLVVGDGFSDCSRNAEIEIRRRNRRGWAPAAYGLTNNRGDYRIVLPDVPGRYRVYVYESRVDDDFCRAVSSATKRHKH